MGDSLAGKDLTRFIVCQTLLLGQNPSGYFQSGRFDKVLCRLVVIEQRFDFLEQGKIESALSSEECAALALVMLERSVIKLLYPRCSFSIHRSFPRA